MVVTADELGLGLDQAIVPVLILASNCKLRALKRPELVQVDICICKVVRGGTGAFCHSECDRKITIFKDLA